MKYSTSVLLLATALGAIRLALPLDFPFSYVINSYVVMPAVRDFFRLDIMPGEEYLKLGTLFLLIWFAGTAVYTAKAVVGFARVKRGLSRLPVVRNEKSERIFEQMQLKNARLIISKSVDVPMVSGVFRASIYVPEIELRSDEWRLILGHEYQHFRNHDALIKLFYLALTAVFWWNPLTHGFLKDLRRVLELRCDAKLTEKMNYEEKEAYLRSIIAVMKQLISQKRGRSINLARKRLHNST